MDRCELAAATARDGSRQLQAAVHTRCAQAEGRQAAAKVAASSAAHRPRQLVRRILRRWRGTTAAPFVPIGKGRRPWLAANIC